MTRLKHLLRCPHCQHRLEMDPKIITCPGCSRQTKVVRGVPLFAEKSQEQEVHLDVVHYINHTRNPWNLFDRGIEDYTADFISDGLNDKELVLDLGGGPGIYSQWMQDKLGKACVVCDLAKYFVLKGKTLHPEVDFVQGNAENLVFRDQSFDAVLCFRSMIYVPDLGKALKEMRRVLKPGGHLIFIDRNRWSPLHWWKYRRGSYNSTIGEFPFYFTLPDLKKKIKQAGFIIEKVTSDHMSIPGLFPHPTLMRPGLQRSLSRLAAKCFPRFGFYLCVYGMRPLHD